VNDDATRRVPTFPASRAQRCAMSAARNAHRSERLGQIRERFQWASGMCHRSGEAPL
jgi:hypothetical protein